jgi:preprotein translocase subunit YajC
MDLFIQFLTQPASPGGGGGAGMQSLIFLLLIIVVFYFFMIRPQVRKQKEATNFRNALKKGDRVMTAGGIYGVIESLSEDSVVIKVESGVTMRVARNSVASLREK